MSIWNLWSDVRTVALRDVLGQRGDYVLRRIYRWYSKTFATPLHLVEELPLEWILQHYFECMWEKLEPDEIQEEKRKILLTVEEQFREALEKDAEKIGESAGEVLALEEVRKVLLGIQSQQEQRPSPDGKGHRHPPLPPQPKALEPMWNPDLGTGMAKAPAPPNINMSFADMSPAEFDAVLDEEPSNLPHEPPRKPRVR